ncbi:ATP-dependent DNA helicase RecG [Aureimonas pseudogalii]|uniref:Probable DNA 3'-5' helicase RecG n=1 Tax=Aureimonas pseudogalii TaxID=1744844 RepID=A0A7W6H8M8_9HYPH|nr:ATP-dependent DNA helicase RecG [Aureimonas pseudogalii]MBB4000567.1 ATP-dependent DNA helicase RecG [Aureimonas pseudogalii]
MRPSALDPLFASVSTLNGVGPKVSTLLAGLVAPPGAEDGAKVRDLLFHLPSGVVDRRRREEIATAPEGVLATLEVRIDRFVMPSREARSQPARVMAQDATGEIALTYFRAQPQWLEKLFPLGETLLVSGKVEWFNGRPQMVHPDFVGTLEEALARPLIEPVYPMTAGLSGKVLRRGIDSALERLPALAEWIEPGVAGREAFPPFDAALRALHHPADPLDLDPAKPAYRRLAYDEFLAGQMALALARQRAKRQPGRVLGGDGGLRRKAEAALPFTLTDGQRGALTEIHADMARPDRMLRLLQGDVGAGKTVVALLAMAAAKESGAQSALLAPTEILARQHFAGLSRFCEAAGLTIVLLTGRDNGRVRAAKLEAIANGDMDIVVGTHALFQDDVAYHDLGLVVVDEQHRFGVHQRLALTRKGKAPDLLVMTATPIPRTLVLAAFGDMDVSRLYGKPAGRKPIATVAVPFDRLDEIVARAGRAIDEGDKLYWVCPLVEETENSDLTAAQERADVLRQFFGDRVGLVHGRMTGTEKDNAMADFKSGRTRIVVATTVIEVGVDVPDASIIVIEHAERFGLSQLHQLRGRVGRGDKASSCVLLYRAPLGETAKARLAVMRETEDGFRIAEEDLKLRGEGDLLGTRQSGLQSFRIADLEAHADLLEIARDDARLLLATDPKLESPRGEAVRALLYLFGKDDAIRLLRSG